MADRNIKTLPPVSRRQEKTALFGLVADSTTDENGRQHTIAGMASSQQRENALTPEVERVVLVQYSGINAANRASETDNNLLSIRTGTTRHSFDDDYFAIETEFQNSHRDGGYTRIIPIELFRESVNLSIGGFVFYRSEDAIRYTSSTSFRLNVAGFDQDADYYFKSIAGLRIRLQ